MTTDLRLLVSRMAEALDRYHRETHPLAAEARAALAEPQPPADGVDYRALCAEGAAIISFATDHDDLSINATVWADSVHDLLTQPEPQPIPVAERPWERDGWCDKEGRCWWWYPVAGIDGLATDEGGWYYGTFASIRKYSRQPSLSLAYHSNLSLPTAAHHYRGQQ